MCIRDSPMTGRIVDVNEPAERLWLRPREDLIGAPQVSLHPVSYTHLRAHETVLDLVCRLLLEKKKKSIYTIQSTQ